MRIYDLRVTVDRIEGRSVCGLRPGDYFELTESSRVRIPEGRHFCLYALSAVLPLLPAKQRRLPDEDWLETETDDPARTRFAVEAARELRHQQHRGPGVDREVAVELRRIRLQQAALLGAGVARDEGRHRAELVEDARRSGRVGEVGVVDVGARDAPAVPLERGHDGGPDPATRPGDERRRHAAMVDTGGWPS